MYIYYIHYTYIDETSFMCTTWGKTETGVNHLNIYAMEKAFMCTTVNARGWMEFRYRQYVASVDRRQCIVKCRLHSTSSYILNASFRSSTSNKWNMIKVIRSNWIFSINIIIIMNALLRLWIDSTSFTMQPMFAFDAWSWFVNGE